MEWIVPVSHRRWFMKTPVRIILAILLFVPACNRNTPSTTRAASEQGSTSNADQRQRDEYVKTVEAKLNEFDKKIDGLEARASKMTDPEKKNFTNEIDQLKDKRKMVGRKLDDLKKLNVESWTSM